MIQYAHDTHMRRLTGLDGMALIMYARQELPMTDNGCSRTPIDARYGVS